MSQIAVICDTKCSCTQKLLHEKQSSAKIVRNILTLFRPVFVYTERRSGQKLHRLEILIVWEYPLRITRMDRLVSPTGQETNGFIPGNPSAK